MEEEEGARSEKGPPAPAAQDAVGAATRVGAAWCWQHWDYGGPIGIMRTKLGLWGPNPTSANSRGGGWWPGAAGWAGTWGRGGSWQRLRFPGVIWKLVPRNSAPTGLSTHKTQCRGRTWGLSELQTSCFQSVQCKPSTSPAYAACWLPKLGWGFLVGQLTAAPGVPLGIWGQVLSLHGCHILAKSCASSLCGMEAGA